MVKAGAPNKQFSFCYNFNELAGQGVLLMILSFAARKLITTTIVRNKQLPVQILSHNFHHNHLHHLPNLQLPHHLQHNHQLLHLHRLNPQPLHLHPQLNLLLLPQLTTVHQTVEGLISDQEIVWT